MEIFTFYLCIQIVASENEQTLDWIDQAFANNLDPSHNQFITGCIYHDQNLLLSYKSKI